MPSLADGDFFCGSSFETGEGLNASAAVTDESAQQHSQGLIRRIDQARHWIDQKKEKLDVIDNKENIEITISEDLADGQTAKLEASLKLLSEDDLKLFVPNDEPEDDEIHMVEKTFSFPAQDVESHALQDYQMQLMLLEQQNKKRFQKARQEKEERQIAVEQVAAVGDFRGKDYSIKIQNKPFQAHMQLIFPAAFKATQAASDMPKAAGDAGTVPAMKRQKRGHRPQNQMGTLDHNHGVVGGSLDAAPAESVEDLPHHFDLLYEISCNESHFGVHPVPAFRDAPSLDTALSTEYRGSSRLHLNGKVPVFDLEAFMEDELDDIAFVVIRTIECSHPSVLMASAGRPLRWTESIYTKSQISKNAMQQIATCYFRPSLEGNIDPRFQSPPFKPTAPHERNRIFPAELFFFHHHNLLKDYATEHVRSKRHIDALLEYVDHQYGEEFAEAESLFARGLVNQMHILNLFKPNELVMSGTYGRPAAFVLQEWPELSSDGWVTLTCWSFQTDGSGFARKRSLLSIPPIDAKTVKIQDLIAYPLEFAPLELRETIRSNGQKQWNLRLPSQVTYKGWNIKKDQFYPDARFMIDHKIYRKMHEHAQAFIYEKPATTHPFDRMPAYLSVEQEPSETSLLLMPPDIHGFYLNEKKWIKIFVDGVHPVAWNKKAYERLVLPPQTKDLVRALVTVRTSQRGVKQGLGVAGKRTDITNGKGNGLIMLLHGGPGTGKTLTAESVAEIAEMPLYRVTCGDIGTNAEAVEKYLNTVLYLGKTWNCVLLLDEADIFLEERSMADLKRNSLVSVFLRILEYYDGILILTSNRVGMFDEAFKSRIQVALHYENLTRSARKKIWQNFLDMLEEDEEDVNFDEIKFHLDDLSGKDLNGRQIRNVLTTARQLAIFKNERLDWEHLEQALAVSADFNEYLKRLPGHTDDQRARDIGLR